jgi:hypothetical protein
MIPISLSAGTVMGVFLTAVIVLGYVVIWAIWHFVFRAAGDEPTVERSATVAHRPDHLGTGEPRSPAERPRDRSARTGPQATPNTRPDIGGAIHDGQESIGSSASDDAPAAGSQAPRVVRPSASSSQTTAQADKPGVDAPIGDVRPTAPR